MTSIKTRLHVLRAEWKWFQAKLTAQVKVTRQTINSIEKGRCHPGLRLACKIVRAFRQRIEEVFLYQESEGRYEPARTNGPGVYSTMASQTKRKRHEATEIRSGRDRHN